MAIDLETITQKLSYNMIKEQLLKAGITFIWKPN
jgi:hypothetical protein